MSTDERVRAVADRIASHRYWSPGTCECRQWRADPFGDVNWQRQWELHVAQDVLLAISSDALGGAS